MRWGLLLAFAVLLGLPSGSAQQPATDSAELAPPPANASSYVLHVYTDRLQVPTLILDSQLKPLPSLTRQKVKISLDGGPLFSPTQLRIEADDPLEIAVLLDASGGQERLLAALPDALAALIPGALHPHDRLSMYAVDCGLFRVLRDAPADAEVVRRSIARVLQVPNLHGEHRTCRSTLALYGAAAHVGAQLFQNPGRRVLLLVSAMHDRRGDLTPEQLARFLGQAGIATFALRDDREDPPTHIGYPPLKGRRVAAQTYDPRDPFNFLANRTGGLAYSIDPRELAPTLHDIVRLIRGRYIVEFPRGRNAEAGMHDIAITVPTDWTAIVHVSGVSTPPSDHTHDNDPTTVQPTGDSPAVFGTRRPKQ